MINKFRTHITLLITISLLTLTLHGCNKASSDVRYDNNANKIHLDLKNEKKIMMPDSAIYEGEYKNGLFHGEGTMVWRNGSVYQGGFKNGLFHGVATLKHANGNIYEGKFTDGMGEGKAHYTMTNGSIYVGNFSKGEFNGQGRYEAKNGNIYQGNFKKGALNGIGKITYIDLGEYTGEVKNWKMEGKGTYKILNEDSIYKGDFVNDIFTGHGEITFSSGDRYVGQVESWLGNGLGELKIKNGEYYKGEFRDGLYDGEGELTYKNNNVYKGSFSAGLRHGKGIYIMAKPKGHQKEKTGWWEYGQYIGDEEPQKDSDKKKIKKKKKQIDAEKIFYHQASLLKQTLEKLKPTTNQSPDMYMINFASYGYQDVFMNEAKFAKNLFDTRFGTQGRSISLINNHKINNNTPLASVTNLEQSIKHVANIMNKDEDILFLFLTSHGSKKHVLSVSLEKLPLNDLSSKELARIIKESKIKWKVIVVSSCYSGGFIKELKDEHTMILTASKADHVSFGCDDKADFTFFGRALFKNALTETLNFKDAFKEARTHIKKWEEDEKYDHSEPQIWTTDVIEDHLTLWKNTLPNELVSSKH